MGEKLTKETARIMDERFGCDSLLALATVDEGKPTENNSELKKHLIPNIEFIKNSVPVISPAVNFLSLIV